MSEVGHQNFVPLRGGGSCFSEEMAFHFFWPTPPVLFDQSLNDLRRLIPVAVASIFLKKNSGLDGNRTHDLCDVGADSLTTEL